MAIKLADHLRSLPDDGLGALLQLRPDLVVPVPGDISQLASRAQSRVSVARALDGLDRFTLEVLDGLRLVRGEAGVASVDALLTLAAEAGVEPDLVRRAIDRLRARFLVFDADVSGNGAVSPALMLHLVSAIDELTTPYPAGLGRSADELAAVARPLATDVLELVSDPAGLRRTLLSATPEARAVLDRLAAGPPIGTVVLRTAAEDSPVRWLVDHGLLVPIAEEVVELPREVGLVLRRDTGPLGVMHPAPPELSGPVRPGADSAGAGQAMEAVRHLDALLHALAEAPATVLRSYGLGVRDARRLGKETGTSEQVTALLLEIAYAAGLLTHTDTSLASADQQWLPSPAYDTWRTAPMARQWATLARTWLRMNRAPALVGQRDDKDKPISALSLEATRGSAPATRRAVLTVLADALPGTAPGSDAVIELLAWQAPRRYLRHGVPGAELLTRAALAEAAALGITGLDAITSYGRVLLDERPPGDGDDPLGIRADSSGDGLIAALDVLLPAPVDHILVQADLTVIIPGPPEPALAAELASLADAESRGGATVYRVTPESVRRGLDAGFTAADIHGLFGRRSRTPLPQTLQYLIDDVARRHGGLRLGSVGSYLRSDDEALISEVLADRRLAGLTLRRLAPTVLGTPHPTGRLLDLLRDAGYAPVAEDASGATVLTRPRASRAPARAAPRGGRVDEFEPPRLTGPRLAGVVEQIRRGDQLARAARRSPLARGRVDADGTPVTAAQGHSDALAVLRQGIDERKLVWVGFVDAHGGMGSKLVRPVSMGGGFLHAEDDRSQTRHTFALHRITSAALDPQDAPPKRR
jgi:hypothetical protein